MKPQIRKLITNLRYFQKRIRYEISENMRSGDEICQIEYVQHQLDTIAGICGFNKPWLLKFKYRHIWSYEGRNQCVDFVLWRKNEMWVCCEIWKRI